MEDSLLTSYQGEDLFSPYEQELRYLHVMEVKTSPAPMNRKESRYLHVMEVKTSPAPMNRNLGTYMLWR